ncbi:MAG TPA: AsmA-like C-terminal region-containing protein [Bacteroidia bacterium]|jgi:hypothetical protein
MINEENQDQHSGKWPGAGPKAPWALRAFLRLVIAFLILCVLIIGTCIVIGLYYQDEVKGYVVGELNKKLNTRVIIDGKDINFTVIENFPYGSVNFRDVKALDAGDKPEKDTLFRAGEISLQFNLLDIFRKDYRVRKLEISDARIRIRIDKNGNDNYHFWKESSDTSTTSFSFALEEIILKNVRFDHMDSGSKQKIDTEIRSGKFSGKFSSETYTLNASADLYVNLISSDSVNYLRKKNVHTEFQLAIDNKINTYKVSSGKLAIEELMFEVFGNAINSGKDPVLNLGVKGKDMDIRSVLSLIPEKFRGRVVEYESEGEFYFSALIRGSISKESSPLVTAEFGIRSADITQIKSGFTLKNVNLKGNYSNGNRADKQVSFLQLSAVSADIGEGNIKGDIKINDLEHPSYSGKITAITSLQELQKFWKIDTVESASGDLRLDASFSCRSGRDADNSFEDVVSSGTLIISNADVKLKNNKLSFSDINGDFKFDNNDLEINSFSGNISGSDFKLKGFFRNIAGFILKKDQDLTIDASLSSKRIDLDQVLANKEESGAAGGKYQLKFSEHINADLKAEIGEMHFRRFEAHDIHGSIKLKDKRMIIDPVVLSTMNGTISTSGMIDGSDSSRILVTCFSEVNKINITRMFEQFENFGQANITDKNIKGIASAKIQFASVLSPELQMDMDKLYAGVDMNIDNGELNNVESMKSLSRFISLKELETIRFASLKNQIEIKRQVISFPKMEIRSNALNVAVSGTHNFNNDIDYHIKLSLNELLSKKAKAAKKQNDEFGEIADDGLGRTNLFLSMTGNISNPVIKYDSKSAVQNVRQDLKVEKQNLKGILKEEFGLFKKDSTLKSNDKKPEPAKMKINWEEADKKEVKKELRPPKKQEAEDF